MTGENRKRIKGDLCYYRTIVNVSDSLNIPTLFFVVHNGYVYFFYRPPFGKVSMYIATKESFWNYFFVGDFYSAPRVRLERIPYETQDSELWYSVNHHLLPKDYYSIDLDSLHPHPDGSHAIAFEIKREGESLTYNQQVGFRILQEEASVELHLIYLREKAG